MMKNLLLLSALVARLAAQAPIASTNLGGGCSSWGPTLSFHNPAGTCDIVPTFDLPPTPTGVPILDWMHWTLIGFSDPNVPLAPFGCSGCTLHTDAVMVFGSGVGAMPAGWHVPFGLTGQTVQCQILTTQLGLAGGIASWVRFPGSCEIANGVSTTFSDGYTVVLP